MIYAREPHHQFFRGRSALVQWAIGFLLMAGVIAGSAQAGEPAQVGVYDVNVSHGLTFTGNKTDAPAPLALRGYDAVAYFADGKPRQGSSEYAASFGGAIYWFATAEHMRMFSANPSQYLPQYGGFCAFGVTQGTKFDGDPLLWNIHKGKLYLNVTPALQQKWLGRGLSSAIGNNLEQNIAQADSLWPKIVSVKPQSLFEAWAAKQ